MKHNFSINQVVTNCVHRINYQSTNFSCPLRICVNIDPVHVQTKLCKGSICLYHSPRLFFFIHSLWQHPVIWNLKAYFGPGIFRMPSITNELQLFFLAQILFQWELDESICLEVLLLLLYWGFLLILLDVKLM